MKILVPTDFSEVSKYALKVAAEVASKTDSEIILLHIIEKPVSMGVANIVSGATAMYVDTELLDQMSEDARQQLLQIKQEFPEITMRLIIAKVYEQAVSDVISEKTADLIIMGTAGEDSFDDYIAGTHTENVVRKSKSPVIVVNRPVSADYTIKNIVFPTDLVNFDEGVLGSLKAFAKMFEAKIHLLYVRTPSSEKSKADLEKFQTKANLQEAEIHIFEGNNEEEGILEFAKENNADLIVMPTHARSGFSLLLNGSVTDDVMNHSHIPVLVLKFT